MDACIYKKVSWEKMLFRTKLGVRNNGNCICTQYKSKTNVTPGESDCEIYGLCVTF